MSETTAVEIERRVRERLQPTHFEIADDSAKHAGHAGAASGGGHYTVLVVSDMFAGKTRVERHRLVYSAVDGMVGATIHALAMKTLDLAEWKRFRKD